MNNCLGNDHDIEGFGCNVRTLENNNATLHEENIELLSLRLKIE